MGLPTKTLGPQPPGALSGLSSVEAQRRLQQVGPNQVEPPRRRARQLATAVANPAAGLLVLACVAALTLGQPLAAAVSGLALAGHMLSVILQQMHTQKTLDRLTARISPCARVLRDGAWQLLPAAGLVPGDLVSLRPGDCAPADLRLLSGRVTLDNPPPGGEAGPGQTVVSGRLVHAGEAQGEVTATGARSAGEQDYPGAAFERGLGRLPRLARRGLRGLAWLDAGLCALALAILAASGGALDALLPFALILLLATIPAALGPALALAEALWIDELGEQGAQPTRRDTIEDAAGLQVILVDKNGLLTENQPSVGRVRAFAPYDEADVLHLAAMASDEAGQEAVDLAILARARALGLPQKMIQRRWVTPADPARRHAEAVYTEDGNELRVIKGAPAAVLGLAGSAPEEVHADINALAALGNRVIAVAVGAGIDPPHLAGLVALQDPPRPDAAALVTRLHTLGVRVVMMSGEARQAAQVVARQVGLRGEVRAGTGSIDLAAVDAYAELLPEDKFKLVRAYQQAGFRVGVTGSSLADVPALSQADLGIATAGACDAARSAAGLALARPGLGGLVGALADSRQATRRRLALILHKLATASALALLLAVGLLLSGGRVIGALPAALLLVSNDFSALALAGAAAPDAEQADRPEISGLVRAAAGLALPLLALALGGLWLGQGALGLAPDQAQTLLFVLLAYGGQVGLYLARDRYAWWALRPDKTLLLVSVLDVLAVTLMAGLGLLVAPLPPGVIAGALAASLGWMGVGALVGRAPKQT